MAPEGCKVALAQLPRAQYLPKEDKAHDDPAYLVDAYGHHSPFQAYYLRHPAAVSGVRYADDRRGDGLVIPYYIEEIVERNAIVRRNPEGLVHDSVEGGQCPKLIRHGEQCLPWR